MSDQPHRIGTSISREVYVNGTCFKVVPAIELFHLSISPARLLCLIFTLAPCSTTETHCFFIERW